jgi:hypothetical protein
MNTIIDILKVVAAIAVSYGIAFGVYGIISTLVKYEVERKMEEFRNRNTDDEEDYD